MSSLIRWITRPGMRRWLGGALLIVLLPGVIASLLLQYRTVERRYASDRQVDLELARSVGATFQAYIQDVLHQELAIGLAVPLALGESVERANGYLADNAAGSPAVRGFAWIDPAGQIVAASIPELIGRQVADRAFFQVLARDQDWVTSDLVDGEVAGVPGFVVGRAVRDHGELRGVVLALVDPTRLGEVLGFSRSDGGTIGIVDRQGWLVYLSTGSDAGWNDAQVAQAVRRALRQGASQADPIALLAGRDNSGAIAISPLWPMGWAAVAGRPASMVMTPLLREAAQNLLMLGVLWAGALVAATTVARRITHPIEALRTHAVAIGRGEQTEPAEVAGPIEVQDLAAAFNTMADGLAIRGREREEYMHAVSHDLRSPLSAIIANVQLLRSFQERAGTDECQRRRSAAIEAAAQRMASMITNLVDAARLENGELWTPVVAVDLGQLVAELVQRMGEPGAAERIELAVEPNLPPVAVDAAAIERVVANLIGNALKYSPPPAPVRVDVRRHGGEIQVTVADQGPGIAAGEQQRLFQRHGRTASGRGRSDSLGLGLYIVRRIVEAHQGRVWVTSQPGVGSTFGVALPSADAATLPAPGHGDTATQARAA